MLLRPEIRLQGVKISLWGLELKKFLLNHLSFLLVRSLHFGGGRKLVHSPLQKVNQKEGASGTGEREKPGMRQGWQGGPMGSGHQAMCCSFIFLADWPGYNKSKVKG